MFFFSKHRKNYRQVKHDLEHEKLAQTWVNRCLKFQHKASLYLQSQSEKLSLGSKRLTVIAFCLISFGSSVYLVIPSFFGNDRVNLPIATIRLPKQVTQSESRQIVVSNGVPKYEIEKIKKFRAYVDSLASSSSGKRLYDSIVRFRPGLLDSLSILENIYKSQISNK